MPTKDHTYIPKSGGKPVGCLFPILGLLGVSAIGFLVTYFWHPEQLAKVNKCASYNETDLTYTNSCDYDINMQYCMWSQSGEEKDFCRDIALAPGESTPSLRNDLAQLGGLLNNQKIACKAPYLPGQRKDMNNKRWKPACLKEGDPDVGPHVSRKPRVYPGQPF